MKICNKSIINFSDIFNNLGKELSASDYQVWFDVKTFSFEEDSELFIENIFELYEKQKVTIAGKIKQTTWHKAWDDITTHLSLTGYDKGTEIPGQFLHLISDEMKKRHSNFILKFISKHISIPPEKVFLHLPNAESYFGDFVMWGFCYVFIHENNGILFSAAAWD